MLSPRSFLSAAFLASFLFAVKLCVCVCVCVTVRHFGTLHDTDGHIPLFPFGITNG